MLFMCIRFLRFYYGKFGYSFTRKRVFMLFIEDSFFCSFH